MDKENALLLWFETINRGDVAIVGGKSASLGEMTSKTAVPVRLAMKRKQYCC